MKKFLALGLIIFSITLGISQVSTPSRPYEQLDFINTEPLWYKTHFDLFYSVDSCDGYNNFRNFNYQQPNYLIEGDYIYQYFTRGGSYQETGTYVFKIDTRTGSQVWQAYFGLPVSPFQEYACLMFINAFDELEIITQLKREPYTREPFNKKLIYTRRMYNKHTGIFIKQERPDASDTRAYEDYRTSQYYSSVDKRRFIRYKIDIKDSTRQHQIVKFKNIIQSNEDSTYWLKPKLTPTVSPVKDIGGNNFILTEADLNQNTLLFRFVDERLNVKKEVLTEPLAFSSFRSYLWDYNISDGSFLVHHFEIKQIPLSVIIHRILKFDKNGKLLKSLIIPKGNFLRYEALEWNDQLKILSTNISFTPDGKNVNHLDVLYEYNDTLLVNKRLAYSDSLRYTGFQRVINLNNGDKLIQWEEEAYYFNSSRSEYEKDINARAQAILRVDAGFFDLSSAENEFQQLDNSVLIFPNPAINDEFSIHSNRKIKSISSFSSIGSKINLPIGGDSDLRYRIDCKNWASGLYLLKIEYTNGKHSIHKVVKLWLNTPFLSPTCRLGHLAVDQSFRS